MDQIETQVSDLHSILGQTPPVGLSPLPARDIGYSPAPHQPSGRSSLSAPGDNSASLTSLTFGAPSDAAKRKADEDETSANKQQRSKRNRYIAIACNECKRRKIKCNGQTPCQRCGNLNLQCLYAPNCCSTHVKDSEEFKQMTEQITHLQEQVDILFRNLDALRQEKLRLAPIQDRILPLPPATAAQMQSPSSSSMRSLPRPGISHPRVASSFSGPTSIAFTVDVAKNTLHNMGYAGLGDVQEENHAQAEGQAELPAILPSFRPTENHKPRDPLWEFDKDEMVRLCRLHEEEVGIMYPVVKIETVIEHAKSLASWMEASKRNGLVPSFGQGEGITDLNTLMLKIIMCCALAVEEHGNSAKAIQLYESIEPIVNKKLMGEPAEVSNLPFLALVAGYRFLSNDEIIAWRVMGQVARLCLEMGLHRREGLEKIRDGQDRKNALNTFWSAYVLDRRWSFGTGLPYVCHDDKIDPKLPYPDDYPYLVAMITYSKLGAKIWRLVDYFEPAVIWDLKRYDFEDLDRQIMEWYDSVPEEVKVSSLNREMIPSPSGPTYDLQRLQVWTRLRLNQIRIWLFTPVLHSAISIADNLPLAQKAVELAKDTIQYLTRLNNTTNLYRRIQVFYHQFLTSAIAVLFLASTHAPVHFSADCRAEFYMALGLVKDMSARSWVSQRLWRTVRTLKAYAPRLGLDENGLHSSGSPSTAAIVGASERYTPVGHHTPGMPITRSSSSTEHSPTATQQSYSRTSSRGPYPPPPLPPSGTQASSHPHSAGSTPGTTHPGPRQITDDQHNGLRLQTEMSRIFEGFMGMNGIPQLPDSLMMQSPDTLTQHGRGGVIANGGEMNANGGSDEAPNSSVYHSLRDMF